MLQCTRTSFFLSLLIIVSIFPNVLNAQITDGLIAYWQFEDNEGSTVIKDYAGEANGTLVNGDGVEYGTGVTGNALNFEPADSNAIGWVEYNEAFDFAWDNFTVSLWVAADPTVVPGEMMIFKKGSSRVGDDPIPDYEPYEWMNIVAVRDVDQEMTFLYVNGEEVAFKIDETTDISGVDLPIQIMNYGLEGSNHNKVNGVIDELKLYNRALNPDEVLSEYERVMTAVHQLEKQQPKAFSICQNYPNPFNPVTTIDFSIARHSHVSLHVYNVQGRIVDVLVNDYYPAGTHSVKWSGQDLSSGIYFYKLEANGQKLVRKMILQK